MNSAGDDTKGGWIYLVGPLGILVGAVGKFTHNHTILGVAIAMLFSAGITGVIQMFRGSRAPAPKTRLTATVTNRSTTQFDSPLTHTYSTTSLVGVRIHHSGGTSVVIEDLDTPMPRRTVMALDTHGRQERLCVGVDSLGSVVEAAVPGSEWAAAEAI
jgi:hypothetical protein